MKVYICGQITGLPYSEAVANFEKRQALLEAEGHEVINPIRLCPEGVTWVAAMRICIQAILTCQAISPLPDTLLSKGAMLEWRIANSLGLTVIMVTNENQTNN